jgi:dephospho-CoA kinase
MAQNKFKIAITGSIGSGKSTFAGFINEKGYAVIKADDISKEILAEDQDVRLKVIRIFGEESFLGNEINRKYLAEKVFSEPQNVRLINSILHPLVIRKVAELMEEALKTKDKVFVEAALIYEADMEGMFDYVVLVTAKKEIRYRRKSKDLKFCDFEKRDTNQIPDEEKRKRADFIFENNDSIEKLKGKANLLLTVLQ